AITWVFTGAGIVLTAGRYAIRLRTVKKLQADDYVHGAALLVLIGYVSTYTVMFPLNYSVEFWVAGRGEEPSARDLTRTAVITSMWCGFNVASDLTIIALPLWMLRGLQMPTSRKLGLAALFLVAITDVIFDITRTFYTVHGGAVALDTIWDILEPTIALIISSLPTYKALLGSRTKSKNTSYQNLASGVAKKWSSTHRSEADQSQDIELNRSFIQAER
ncbi:MAG: hypothetical protein Q9195_005076, partial [Heterodermia aff. obscurata]